jgi:molecular chaperone Hsp33
LPVVECNDAMELRGTAQWDSDRVAALLRRRIARRPRGVPRRTAALTLDPRDAGALCQGIVSLDATSVAADLSTIWRRPSSCGQPAVARVHDRVVRGLLLQRLPGDEAQGDATWRAFRVEADAGARSALDSAGFRASQTLFAHDDLRVFDTRPVTFRCKCVARVANALRIAGRDEIEAALAERGVVE